jgi:hypothetical protein
MRAEDDVTDSELRSDPTRARKNHCCEWCGELIKVGEVYTRDVGVFQGDFYSSPLHTECKEASKEYVVQSLPDDAEFSSWSMERGKPCYYGEGE